MRPVAQSSKQSAVATDSSPQKDSVTLWRPRVRRSLRKLGFAIISFSVLLIVWHLSVGTLFNPVLVASPEATFTKIATMLESGELIRHVAVSLERVLIGYVVGCTLGIVLGAIIGRIKIAGELIDP